jgi:hypothetical protein
MDAPVIRGRQAIVPLAGAAVAAALILGFSWRYGIFRDELYYLACARRLAWGYVDHPPFSIAVLTLFGESLFAIKIPCAIAFALVVALVGREAARRGADAWETSISVLATLFCPLFLAVASFYSMNVLEIAFWAAAMTISARLLEAPSTGRWVALAIVIGLGALNKYSMLMFPLGLCAGMLLSPARRQFFTRGPWIAGVSSGLIFLPHVLWEARHGSPSLEFMHNATAFKMVAIGPLDFVKEQLVATNPILAVAWMAGLIGLLASRRLRTWRPHAFAFLVVAAVLIASGKSRAGYLAPAYTLLLPAGGIALGRFVSSRALRAAVMTVLVIGGLVSLPLALPVLPVDRLIAYQQAIGFAPRAEEHSRLGPLPQFLADRFGWQEMASAVERAYRALPPDEQAHTYIFTGNYGEAGAIEYFSPLLRDRVLSGHNNYHLWFPQGWDGSELLVIGNTVKDVHKAFADVTEVGRTGDNPYAMPYERNHPILLGRRPIQTIEELRIAIKHYN